MLDYYGYRHTLRICDNYSFPWQNSLRESASILRLHLHSLSLPIFSLLMEQYRVLCEVRIEYFYIVLIKFISKG